MLAGWVSFRRLAMICLYVGAELLITDLTEGRENVVDGLQPDKEYVVKAWTMTRAGQSTSWAEKRLHTLEGGKNPVNT